MRGVVAVRRWALALAVAATAGFGTTAVRADAWDKGWTGFYSGAELGSAWSTLDWNFQNANYFNTSGGVVIGNAFDQSPSGVIGGAFGGYTYQSGP